MWEIWSSNLATLLALLIQNLFRKQARYAELAGWRGKYQEQNLIPCQDSGSQSLWGPEILKFIRANLPCSPFLFQSTSSTVPIKVSNLEIYQSKSVMLTVPISKYDELDCSLHGQKSWNSSEQICHVHSSYFKMWWAWLFPSWPEILKFIRANLSVSCSSFLFRSTGSTASAHPVCYSYSSSRLKKGEKMPWFKSTSSRSIGLQIQHLSTWPKQLVGDTFSSDSPIQMHQFVQKVHGTGTWKDYPTAWSVWSAPVMHISISLRS